MSPEEFAEVENIAKEFGKPGGLGEKLQEELIKRHDTMDNWVWIIRVHQEARRLGKLGRDNKSS